MFAPESSTVPVPSKVSACPDPEITPDTVKVFPDVPMLHVGLPLKAIGLPMLMLTFVRPIAPTVNVPKPVMPMSPAAPDTEMLPQDLEVPSVNPDPSEALDQVATSEAVGAPFAPAPPDQANGEATPVRSVPEACLVTAAPKVDGASTARRLKHAMKAGAVAVLMRLLPDPRKFAACAVPVWRKNPMRNGRMEGGRGAVLIVSVSNMSAHKITLTH